MTTETELAELIRTETYSKLGPLKSVPSGWKKQNCKLCHHRGQGHDKRERFGIKVEGDGTIIVNCFNCGFSASWSPGNTLSKSFKWFLITIGMSDYDVKRIDFELYKHRNQMDTANKITFRDITKKWTETELPKGAKTIDEWASLGTTDSAFLQVVTYLAQRKLLYPKDFYWTPDDPMYKKRAILPFKYEGKIVGHTGRLAGESKKLKYMAHTPKGYLANLDSQKSDTRKYVILCEGIFDAYLVDGIAALGNTLSQDQISIIERLGKEIIVVPDKDKAGQELFDIAVKQGWTVSTPNWGKGIKDPASAVEKYGRVLTVQSIIASRDKNAFSAKIKRKLDKF